MSNHTLFFAEPVHSSDLREGGVYFMLNYFDVEMLVPDMKTLVFIGMGLNGETSEMLYFQDYESFVEWGAFPKPIGEFGKVIRCAADNVTSIFELDKAINILQQCHKRLIGTKG